MLYVVSREGGGGVGMLVVPLSVKKSRIWYRFARDESFTFVYSAVPFNFGLTQYHTNGDKNCVSAFQVDVFKL